MILLTSVCENTKVSSVSTAEAEVGLETEGSTEDAEHKAEARLPELEDPLDKSCQFILYRSYI